MVCQTFVITALNLFPKCLLFCVLHCFVIKQKWPIKSVELKDFLVKNLNIMQLLIKAIKKSWLQPRPRQPRLTDALKLD